MIIRIETPKGGRHARNLQDYLLDKRSHEENLGPYILGQGREEKVAWADAVNCGGIRNIDLACKYQRVYNEQNTVSKAKSFHLTIALHPDDRHLSPEQLQFCEEYAVNKLGMGDHPRIRAEHQDQPHQHLHSLGSRVEPDAVMVRGRPYHKVHHPRGEHYLLNQAADELENRFGLIKTRHTRNFKETHERRRELAQERERQHEADQAEQRLASIADGHAKATALAEKAVDQARQVVDQRHGQGEKHGGAVVVEDAPQSPAEPQEAVSRAQRRQQPPAAKAAPETPQQRHDARQEAKEERARLETERWADWTPSHSRPLTLADVSRELDPRIGKLTDIRERKSKELWVTNRSVSHRQHDFDVASAMREKAGREASIIDRFAYRTGWPNQQKGLGKILNDFNILPGKSLRGADDDVSRAGFGLSRALTAKKRIEDELGAVTERRAELFDNVRPAAERELARRQMIAQNAERDLDRLNQRERPANRQRQDRADRHRDERYGEGWSSDDAADYGWEQHRGRGMHR
jgi:Relaxase/Mobilisation nuclease domain